MTGLLFFNRLIVGWLILATGIFVALFFFAAPYGRHIRPGWGPTLDSRISWLVMESMSPVMFAACFFLGQYTSSITAVVFLVLWEAHYIHRAFIFPLDLRNSEGRMPLLIVVFAFVFNGINAYINGRYLFVFSGGYSNAWLTTPEFIIGTVIFIVGFIINRNADLTLRNLRKPGEDSYSIPYGGLYRWVSCPNYLGEILIWSGWAIATWSLAGLTFAIWTAANLIPRARSNHQWYRTQFSDYPTERKAILPGIW